MRGASADSCWTSIMFRILSGSCARLTRSCHDVRPWDMRIGHRSEAHRVWCLGFKEAHVLKLYFLLVWAVGRTIVSFLVFALLYHGFTISYFSIVKSYNAYSLGAYYSPLTSISSYNIFYVLLLVGSVPFELVLWMMKCGGQYTLYILFFVHLVRFELVLWMMKCGIHFIFLFTLELHFC